MKVPKPEKQKNGKYRMHLRLSGQSYSAVFDTEREAIRWAEKIKAEHRAEYGAAKRARKQDLTLDEAISAYIRDNYNVLSPSTRRGYDGMRRSRFQSVMQRPLSKITNWQQLINAEAAKVSAKTVANAWGLVHRILVYNGLPVPEVNLPLVMPSDTLWLDHTQIPIFVSGVKGQLCETAAILALHSLRRSEILNLRWGNVDLKKGTITVAGAAVMDENEKLVHKSENKNASSRRVVPILIPELGAALEKADKSGEYVCPISAHAIYSGINRVCEANGLPPVGIHGLRRSFASLAYHLGWSERLTMKVGGWNNPATMHKLYIKIADADLQKATDSMAAFYNQRSANEP